MQIQCTKEYNLVSVIEQPTGETAGLVSAKKLRLLPAALPAKLLEAHGETKKPCPWFFVVLVSAVVAMVAREPGLQQPLSDGEMR